ncbi:SpoIIE family protein phosphatase [Streptomyces sp. NPDC101225]|uniref:ATP-binding SpoIIE family protein phosphatase n=1 Tax=Streptomyces sp. NPDC101225 TaxID=3366135 RepID=UPI0038054B1C
MSASSQPDNAAIKQWALEQVPLPMALFDRRGIRFAANAAMAQTLGKPSSELLGLPIGHIASGQPVKGLEGLVDAVGQVWAEGAVVLREVHFRMAGDARASASVLSLYPVRDRAGRICAVSLVGIDTTEQFRARQRLGVLNEAGLRIGTTLDVVRTADEMAEVGAEHFADFVAVDLFDHVIYGEETPRTPSSGGQVVRRVAQRSPVPECPEALLPLGAIHAYPDDSSFARVLARGRAVLHHADAAPEPRAAADGLAQARLITTEDVHSVMIVPLRARGATLGMALFCRPRSVDPFDTEDLLLAEDLAARAAVYMDNARRYTRERRVALALQSSLLPGRALRQSAVEVAFRYLPADPSIGISGDWFDVIPLSSARVALVVGDVVGHGIGASATMGRLCTAVRTLADVDLAPDELLTQLDDLVLRLDREAMPSDPHQPPESSGGEVGATCLYAVYDPVTRRCSMARAGHPAPALATPDGAVTFLDVPAGPPLGVGGLPFEVAEFELPEGSVLAFYTDGLVGGVDRDMDAGCAVLGEVLAGARHSLEAACDRALESLRPDLRSDDAVLLLAHTHALSLDQVAGWELAVDPTVAARARDLVCDQLAAWHLSDHEFVIELVVSELVTNALRYGKAPVLLRLIRDTSLICEVSDSSSTAPHLRRARVYDEGGRGLLIVAQLTQRWGCRHTSTGKTIWADVPLTTPRVAI